MNLKNEDGYELWLRYHPVDNPDRLAQYRHAIGTVTVPGTSETSQIISQELTRSLPILLDKPTSVSSQKPEGNALIVGTIGELESLGINIPPTQRQNLGAEGFLIDSYQSGENIWLVITGNTETAVLTGTFHFLRLLQTHRDVAGLHISSRPRIHHRILAHWDNVDGSIERGYAGQSLWNWAGLPETIDPRYHDYARACASIGLNGTCLNNVNAQAKSLTAGYLLKTAALADVFRPYGLRVYLSPVFSAPMQIGGETRLSPNGGRTRWTKSTA